MNTNELEEADRIWRQRWLSELFLFSHIQYQTGLWVNHSYTNEIGWFTENVCTYFDDLYLDDDYQYQLKDGSVKEEEYEAIKAFHFAFRQFIKHFKSDPDKDWPTQKGSELQIINNPDWIKVVTLGLTAWEHLKSIIKDPAELEHMHGLERNYLSDD